MPPRRPARRLGGKQRLHTPSISSPCTTTGQGLLQPARQHTQAGRLFTPDVGSCARATKADWRWVARRSDAIEEGHALAVGTKPSLPSATEVVAQPLDEGRLRNDGRTMPLPATATMPAVPALRVPSACPRCPCPAAAATACRCAARRSRAGWRRSNPA